MYSGIVARSRKAELDELGIIFDSNSDAKARPGLPGIVSRTIAQPADLELKIAGQRATVVGLAVLEDPVDDELARFSGRNSGWVDVGDNMELVKASTVNTLRPLNQ